MNRSSMAGFVDPPSSTGPSAAPPSGCVETSATDSVSPAQAQVSRVNPLVARLAGTLALLALVPGRAFWMGLAFLALLLLGRLTGLDPRSVWLAVFA